MVADFLALAAAFAGPAPQSPPPLPPAPPSPPAISRPAPPPAPQAPPPVAPTRWRLADRWGQAWEGPDRAALESFVRARDASTAPAAPAYAPSFAPAPRCATGTCPRR